MLAWRLRGRPQGSSLLAPRAAQDPIHIISSRLFISTQRFAAYRDTTARHPYRDIGEGDPRGVIRLTCGSH